jgi:hypothetical protein
MKIENKQKLKRDFPSFFRHRADISGGDGWFDIVHKICTEISLYLNASINQALRENFYVTQIKEKFGSLRFYVSLSEPTVDAIIDKYEVLSFDICEECGASHADMYIRHGWLKTICQKCADRLGDFKKYDKERE